MPTPSRRLPDHPFRPNPFPSLMYPPPPKVAPNPFSLPPSREWCLFASRAGSVDVGRGDYQLQRAEGTKVGDVEDLPALGKSEVPILVVIVGVDRQDMAQPHLAISDKVRSMPLLPYMAPW